MAWE
jgi:hypothetical protein